MFLPQWLSPSYREVLVNDQWLRIPRRLKRQVGVDWGYRRGTYFERPAMLALRAVLRRGDVFWDAGSSYGILSCLAATLVGDTGTVAAFEANPSVFNDAREIVQVNGLGSRVRIEHGALGEQQGGTVAFFAVPGTDSVASTRNAEIQKFHAAAERVEVPALSLDGYAEATGGRPDCIKIDVEGSEFVVCRGAKRLIERSRPSLVIETHGLEIDGIGGSVAALCALLEDWGYLLFDLEQGKPVAGGEYAALYAQRIGYLLAAASLDGMRGR